MPKYFFETFDGKTAWPDDRGIDCHSRGQVSDQAVRALVDMVRDELPDGSAREFRVVVRDEALITVFEASLVLNSSWND
ncbi:DUF6894 family protein [Mesorhizobium sp. IMUNJ 23232]|uniref:DUF6894 family protein n=1 Tax=Mesorhizobium sp. IMUNJ 23232 TaxID=3376064 RepID=UPI0037A4C0B1